MQDYITIEYEGVSTKIAVVQIWIDPKRKEEWRNDDQLWEFMNRRGKENMATILRFNSKDVKIIFPPVMSDDHQWHEVDESRVNLVREKR
jgi:hypothetical protein